MQSIPWWFSSQKCFLAPSTSPAYKRNNQIITLLFGLNRSDFVCFTNKWCCNQSIIQPFAKPICSQIVFEIVQIIDIKRQSAEKHFLVLHRNLGFKYILWNSQTIMLKYLHCAKPMLICTKWRESDWSNQFFGRALNVWHYKAKHFF